MAGRTASLFDVVARVWTSSSEKNFGLISAGIAFYAMLAIFPATAAIIAIWGIWADPNVISEQLELLQSFVPADAFALFSSQVETLIGANDSTLGFAFIVSLLAALWSSRSGVAALILSLNSVHGLQDRGGVSHYLAAIGLTLVLIGVILVAIGMVVLVPIAIAVLPAHLVPSDYLLVLRWALFLAVGVSGLVLLYRFGPNFAGLPVPRLSIGVIFGVLVWTLVSWGFATYLTNFGAYNRVYGSIGAVIALLMWFYLSAWIVLVGASINAELASTQSTDPRKGA